MKTEDELATIIIGVAIDIHSKLGPGLLESAYQECLCYKLAKMGLKVERQKILPIYYEDLQLNAGYRLDVLVENKVVVELKCVDGLNDVHLAQVLTYLKMGNYKLGLLINFKVTLLKYGLRRVANNMIPMI